MKMLILGTSTDQGIVNKLSSEVKLYPTRLIGTIVIVLSGIILYSDKVMAIFNYRFVIPSKFISEGMNFQTFIWLISQTISPIFIIIGSYFKPYSLAYAVPLYCYALQLMFLFNDYDIIDDSYLGLYSIGSMLIIIAIVQSIKYLSKLYIKNQIKQAKENLLRNDG